MNVPFAQGEQYGDLKGECLLQPGPPNAVLSLCSRNSLIEERICVVGTTGAQCVACEIAVKLPKDIWKRRG